MSEEIKEKIGKAALVYSEKTGLRAGIVAIPYIGASIDILLSEKGKEIVQERIETMISKLQDEVSNLEKENIREDFLKTDEFFDLILQIYESAIRTRQDEKITLYAKILKNSIRLDKEYQEFEPEEYLRILVNLTPREILVTSEIYRQQKGTPPAREDEYKWVMENGWDELPKQTGINKDDLFYILLRLQGNGLIREIITEGLSFTPSGGIYMITETFRNLMKFIDDEL